MIDRITAKLGRRLYEVPVGFKWFSAGLLDGSLGFGGEESAGATFLRRDGSPIGGMKVRAASDWFAARPSGTEAIYKIYAESVHGQEHLRQILKEAQDTVDAVLRQP
jgi:phosphoglucomutase